MAEKREKTEAEVLGEALKPRERLFVRELLVDLNGTRAAIRAGYAEKSAASQASRLLRKPEIKGFRDALLKEQFEALGITKHSIAAEVWEIYERCMQKTAVRIWDEKKHQYVLSGLWEFDARGALKALKMLHDMLPETEGSRDEEPSFEDTIDGGGNSDSREY